MRKRHFLCKEITDMQWEVTDGKVSEKDGHTDMERTGMKTVIKKGIKIYSPKIKKQKKGKGSLQAICKNKRRVFLCFFRKTRGKKAADPGGAYCGRSSGYPFVSAWNLYLAWNNGSVPGAGTCENISASERTGAWYVCQCGKRGIPG